MSLKLFFKETDTEKILKSENYNFHLNKVTGRFLRWGKTFEDDPQVGLPEILDIEISEICHGVNNTPCPFCYKSNVGHKGRNMNLETFKKVLDNLFFLKTEDFLNEKSQENKKTTIGQIAFGIGDIEGNPDLKEIILHTRERGIVPNITINGDGLTDEWVKFFSENLGAIAVSIYDKEISYNAIQKLTEAGMTQVNIHFMIANETLNKAYEIMNDTKTDPRLKNLNALVLLSLKQKGRGEGFTKLSQEDFTKLVQHGMSNDIRLGFDSCGACKFLESIKNDKNYLHFVNMVEPCESGLFSTYINVEGKFFPCSFAEGVDEWKDGIDCTQDEFDFLKDVWFSDKVNKWRDKLLKNNRECPLFDV